MYITPFPRPSLCAKVTTEAKKSQEAQQIVEEESARKRTEQAKKEDEEEKRRAREENALEKAEIEGGVTPLHVACSYGKDAIVKQMLDTGANASTADDAGNTPLHCAASGGHESIVQLLLTRGVDVNRLDGEGCTPLRVAAEESHSGVVRMLLAHGADAQIGGPYKNVSSAINGILAEHTNQQKANAKGPLDEEGEKQHALESAMAKDAQVEVEDDGEQRQGEAFVLSYFSPVTVSFFASGYVGDVIFTIGLYSGNFVDNKLQSEGTMMYEKGGCVCFADLCFILLLC